jgi:phage terminase large subunit GpA-like protein
VALPACTRCGTTDPRRMYGLMTLWFGPFADVEPAQGYFHLCPACYRATVQPHVEKVQGRLAELHPAAAAHLDREAAREARRSEQRPAEPADDQPSAEPGERANRGSEATSSTVEPDDEGPNTRGEGLSRSA